MYLQTKHLTLREFKTDDLDALFSLLGDAKVMHFSVAGPLSREQTRDYLEKRLLDHYAQFGFGLWAVIHTEDQLLIGCAGLLIQSIDGEDLVELGYRLDPRYWGKGLASEAARAISQYAFDHLHLDQIISIIDPKNTRSLSVATRLGMTHWKEALFHNIPVQIYALRRVAVVPFDQTWAEKFAEIERQLKGIFKDLDIAFFHIGSTSLPMCSAKPVIDILGVTPDITEIDRFNPEMAASGFRPLGEHGMKQRRFFQRQPVSPVNLHIFENTDPEAGRHLRFCRYLRSHPDLVKEYSALKAHLARHFPHDIQKYILGKEKFIKNVDLRAAREASLKITTENEPLKKKQWTPEEIVKAWLVNMHLQKIYFAKYVPSLDLVFEPDVTVLRSQIPDSSFNHVLSARFMEKNAQDRITQVLGHFRKFHLPVSWWVSGSDSPSSLGDLLLQRGVAFLEKSFGMYRDLGAWDPASAAAPLVFRRVESPEQLKHFAELFTPIGRASLAYDLIYSQLPRVIYCGRAPLEIHIGYLENVPVVSGVLLTHANVAGIYCVATTPPQRDRDLETAMIKHLLDLAKAKGYFIATAQGSEDELPLYEQLGFKECCQISKYVQNNKGK